MEQVSWNDEEWRGAWDPFVRLAYQFGMMLGVDEFHQEQGYHVTKHRLSQRLFVGWGLVWGGKVEAKVTGSEEKLTVNPLYALDELGRELWLKEPCTLDLKQWAEQNAVGDGMPVYLCLAYRACSVSPVPAIAAPCDDSASPTMPSRAMETAECSLMLDPPPAPLDISDGPQPAPGTAQSARFATLVELIRNDAARPMLLGSLVRTTDGGGQHVWTFTQEPGLPLVPMVGGAAFRVTEVSISGLALKVTFSAPPLYAPITAFRMDEMVAPAADPVRLVDETKLPAPEGDGKVLSIPLKSAPVAGKLYRISVAGTGPTPVLADSPHGPVALQHGKDFVRFLKPSSP
jgi:hypothetical protein